jgi:hypothetical protein
MCQPRAVFAHFSKACSFLVKARRIVGGKVAKSTLKSLLWARYNSWKHAEAPAKETKKQKDIRAKARAKLRELEQKVAKVLKNSPGSCVPQLLEEALAAVVVPFDELRVWKVTRARFQANRLLQLAPECVVLSKDGAVKSKPFLAGMCAVFALLPLLVVLGCDRCAWFFFFWL